MGLAAVVAAGAIGFGGVWALMRAGGPSSAPASVGPERSIDRLEEALAAARVWMEQADDPKAEAVLRSVLDEWGEDQELRLALAEALLGQEKLAEAYAEYERALSIGPRTAELEFSAGTLAAASDEPERALEHYVAAQHADPKDPRFPLYAGVLRQRLGDRDAAKADLLRAQHLDASSPVAWGMLAQIALDENSPSLARQHAERARVLDPETFAWRILEARALKRLGEPEMALTILLAGEIPGPDAVQARVLAAECFGLLQRPEDAAALYTDAVERDPADAESWYQAALWLERCEDPGEALRHAERASMLNHPRAGTLADRLRGES